MEQLWNQLDEDTRSLISKELKFRNYKEDVFIDEFQAYVIEGPNELGKKVGPYLKEAHKVLKMNLALVPI